MSDTCTRMIAVTHLQDHAVVSWGFILAAVVLTQVNINMIQLQEANQVSRGLQVRQKKTGKKIYKKIAC